MTPEDRDPDEAEWPEPADDPREEPSHEGPRGDVPNLVGDEDDRQTHWSGDEDGS